MMLLAFAAGVTVGCIAGIVVLGLCYVAARADDRMAMREAAFRDLER